MPHPAAKKAGYVLAGLLAAGVAGRYAYDRINPPCTADIDGNGEVTVIDGLLAASWTREFEDGAAVSEDSERTTEEITGYMRRCWQPLIDTDDDQVMTDEEIAAFVQSTIDEQAKEEK